MNVDGRYRINDRPARVRLRRPPYITTGEAAKIFNIATRSTGWTPQKARRFLVKMGVVVKLTNGPRAQWVTTTRMLRERFPDIWDAVMRILPEDGDD